MKTAITRKLAMQTLLAVATGLASASTMAATSWSLDTCSNQQATNTGNFGNSYVCSGASGTNKVTASAYGGQTTNSVTTYQTAFLKQNGSSSGFGVASKDEGIAVSAPNHSMDNSPSGFSDMILLKFDTAVALGSISLGWTQSDADITVMAYVGGGAPTIIGKTTTNLTSGGAGAGWSLISNHGDADAANATPLAGSGTDVVYTNAANVSSSWWLISAYNAGFGGGTLDSLTDYVKLLAIASKDVPGVGGKVPEPTSLALTGLALAGVFGLRRRQQKAAA